MTDPTGQSTVDTDNGGTEAASSGLGLGKDSVVTAPDEHTVTYESKNLKFSPRVKPRRLKKHKAVYAESYDTGNGPGPISKNLVFVPKSPEVFKVGCPAVCTFSLFLSHTVRFLRVWCVLPSP